VLRVINSEYDSESVIVNQSHSPKFTCATVFIKAKFSLFPLKTLHYFAVMLDRLILSPHTVRHRLFKGTGVGRPTTHIQRAHNERYLRVSHQ